MKHPFFICVSWLTITLLLSSCSSVLVDPQIPSVPDEQSMPEMYQPLMEEEYRIRIGDKLTVRSYYDRQLNQDVLVRPDGRISVLLLNDVKALGYTPNELSAQLSEQYAKHIQTANVTVSVAKAIELSIYIGGEVKRPSKQLLTEPLTVMQAITAAGGVRSTANSNQVIILRRQDDGKFLAYQLDIEKVLVNQAADVYLKRFDIVHVPMSPIAHVGKFVDQHINKIIPTALRFSGSYTWIEDVNDDSTPTQLQVVGP